MNFLKTVFIAIALAASAVALADEASIKEAEKLLQTMGTEAALEQSMSQMIDVQLQQNPALAPYKGVMMEFFNKYTSYNSLKLEMAQTYAEAFTLTELQEINAFYASEVGQKVVQVMPQLMAAGAQMGVTRVQENIGELQEMIKAESERIQMLQQQ
ncbi:Uncharacterised protein [Halioglobus japonicus]|nr:Uncharacterised protein [Halioglobus japonicus]